MSTCGEADDTWGDCAKVCPADSCLPSTPQHPSLRPSARRGTEVLPDLPPCAFSSNGHTISSCAVALTPGTSVSVFQCADEGSPNDDLYDPAGAHVAATAISWGPLCNNTIVLVSVYTIPCSTPGNYTVQVACAYGEPCAGTISGRQAPRVSCTVPVVPVDTATVGGAVAGIVVGVVVAVAFGVFMVLRRYRRAPRQPRARALPPVEEDNLAGVGAVEPQMPAPPKPPSRTTRPSPISRLEPDPEPAPVIMRPRRAPTDRSLPAWDVQKQSLPGAAPEGGAEEEEAVLPASSLSSPQSRPSAPLSY